MPWKLFAGCLHVLVVDGGACWHRGEAGGSNRDAMAWEWRDSSARSIRLEAAGIHGLLKSGYALGKPISWEITCMILDSHMAADERAMWTSLISFFW